MNILKTNRSEKGRYPIQTSVPKNLDDRIQRLRSLSPRVLITDILEAGCLVIEKKKGIKNEI